MKKKTREQRLKEMTPGRRAYLERVLRLREKIGPLDFNILEALRELRSME
jgi:hypothetical protein